MKSGTRQTPAAKALPLRTPEREPDRLLSPAEAADLFGMRADTVRAWIRKGVIPVVRVGPFRRPKIRESVARRLLQ